MSTVATVPLTTEKVTLTTPPIAGTTATATFWIAYPLRIASYGDVEYRVAMAWGTGATCTEALRAAANR